MRFNNMNNLIIHIRYNAVVFGGCQIVSSLDNFASKFGEYLFTVIY